MKIQTTGLNATAYKSIFDGADFIADVIEGRKLSGIEFLVGFKVVDEIRKNAKDYGALVKKFPKLPDSDKEKISILFNESLTLKNQELEKKIESKFNLVMRTSTWIFDGVKLYEEYKEGI